MKDSVLVVFGDSLPGSVASHREVVASRALKPSVEKAGLQWVDLDAFLGPGSIYEASALLEELSRQDLDGERITKVFLYKGYELWWLHCTSLFQFFCLPYTQHKKLLEHLRGYQKVYTYGLQYQPLYTCYLQAHGIHLVELQGPQVRKSSLLPFGVLLQILLTLVSVPFLILLRRPLLVYTGDKFEKGKDYDFRMRFVYEELRARNQPFVEFIRGLEPWRKVLSHAWTRKRPVIYSEAVVFLGRYMSFVTGGHRKAKHLFGPQRFSTAEPEARFKLLLATQYLLSVYEDVWAIRIMRNILRLTGVRSAFIPVASERNFHTLISCKLLAIPTVGILHGASSRHYNVSDFLSGFNGEKSLSVDTYGLWSEWWKEYYLQHADAYRPEQLQVSGPMRPLEGAQSVPEKGKKPLKVLFVPGELSAPQELIPYIHALLEEENVSFYLTFRPYRDAFENWLQKHDPELIKRIGPERIFRGRSIEEDIAACDVVVGTYSTAVLEAYLQLKPGIFFATKKWGDYFSLEGFDDKRAFYARTPEELIAGILSSEQISVELLQSLQERFFGSSKKNGSKWVVERAIANLGDL